MNAAGLICYIADGEIHRYDQDGVALSSVSLPADRLSYWTRLGADANGRYYVAAKALSTGRVYIDRLDETGSREMSWRVPGDLYVNHTVATNGDCYVQGAGGAITKVFGGGAGFAIDETWANGGVLYPEVGYLFLNGTAVAPEGDLYLAGLSSGIWSVSRFDASGTLVASRMGYAGRPFGTIVAIVARSDGRVVVAETGINGGSCGVTSMRFDGPVASVGGEGENDTGTGPEDALIWLVAPTATGGSGHTELRYSAGASGGDVRLRVYDVRGRLVGDLVNQHMGPGVHVAVWHQDDRHGTRVASGVYLVQLVANGMVRTIKTAVIR